MDQLTNNAVSLHLGTDLLTYLKLPDGGCSLPPGVTSRLLYGNGLFSIQESFGRDIAFNAERKARLKLTSYIFFIVPIKYMWYFPVH